jgi:hypothetical protein
MDVLIKDEWIRLEKATGMVAASSGVVVGVGESGQVTAEDELYVWDKPSEAGGAGPTAVEEGSGLLH